jgi:hypothetical protein
MIRLEKPYLMLHRWSWWRFLPVAAQSMMA